MKIRNRHLVRLAGWLGGVTARSLIGSLSLRVHYLGPDVGDGRTELDDRLIYCIWHDSLLLPAARFGGRDLAVLISKHADGQILGGLITAMGMEMVQGSTNRGGVEAVRNLLRDDVRWRNLAVTPDGPRGPRRIVQAGIVYIASRTGMKIIPVGVGYRRPWRLGSWDRFAIPKPCSRGRVVAGDLFAVPPNLRSAALEEYRLRLQSEMDRVNAMAESWVENGRLDRPDSSPQTQRRLAS